MGLVFDRRIAAKYDSWCRSPVGRSIDSSIEELFSDLVNPRRGERALDIGCGAGNHLIILKKLGLDVTGIDASSFMLKRAEKRLGNRCTLRKASADDLPFDDNEFDLAVLINALEFMDDPVRVIGEAGRVAKRKVFIGVLNSLSRHGAANRIRGLFGDPLFSRVRLYNMWELRSLLRAACGDCPTAWGCVRSGTPLMKKTPFSRSRPASADQSPFGSFLAVAVTMRYIVKTDNLPLKVRIKRAGRPLIGVGSLKNRNTVREAYQDERGLSV